MKGKNSRGVLKGQSIFEAIFVGFLIAIAASLFVQYFGVDVSLPPFLGITLSGVIIADLLLLVFVGVPGRLNGTLIVVVILVVLSYATYGPYAEYLRGPMMNIRESMQALPSQASEQMHCLTLLFTNPMAYTTECLVIDQRKGPEEKPEDVGLEISKFEILPEGEIYAGMPLQIWAILENKGDYDATNLSISSSSGKYDVCKIDILENKTIEGNFSEKVNPKEEHRYGVTAEVADPWRKECAYAKNKEVIGGTIKFKYSYEYQTESYLNIVVVKDAEDSKEKFRVESALEKSAPANVLMFTFLPLIWESKLKTYREATIPISFKNERRNGKIIFRGLYVYYINYLPEGYKKEDWCNLTCSELDEFNCMNDCKKSYKEINSTYHHCIANTTKELLAGIDNETCENMKGYWNYKGKYKGCVMGVEISADNKTECDSKGGTSIYGEDLNFTFCLNSTTVRKIDANETECENTKGLAIYKVKGKYERSDPDKIRIYIVGNVMKYASLSCGEKESEVVMCSGGENEVTLTWKNGKLDLKPNEKKFVYSGVKLSLGERPWPEEGLEGLHDRYFNFAVKAEATYRVKMEKSERVSVHNPHYEDYLK